MAKAKKTSEQKIAEAFHEVHARPPSTLKPGKSAEATRKQQIAIGLSKAREKGAKIKKQ